MRLNLGCGHRPLAGYINLDVSETADIQSDIRSLPFGDESADEVMAIHAIEHFYFWEVEALLTEWKRVLKPGCKLILELPDLSKIVRNFVKGETAVKTILGLYGDPSHKSVLMTHKWAYTFGSLKAILAGVGFRDIVKLEPEWHFQIRDMRVEAVK